MESEKTNQKSLIGIPAAEQDTPDHSSFRLSFLTHSPVLSHQWVIVGTVIAVIILISSSLLILGGKKTSVKQEKQKVVTTPTTNPTISPTPIPSITLAVLQKLVPSVTPALAGSVNQNSAAPTSTQQSSSPTHSIQGYVYQDSNGNKSHDSGDSGISGVTVWILSLAKSTTTDSSGHYFFGSLPMGTYNVTVNVPSGYNLEGSNPSFVTISNSDATADFGFTGSSSGSSSQSSSSGLSNNPPPPPPPMATQ